MDGLGVPPIQDTSKCHNHGGFSMAMFDSQS